MAITYRTTDNWDGIKFPVLYKVKYADTAEGIEAQYQYSYKDHLVNAWLEENCKSAYYHSPGYLKEKFIEFEDDEEAVLFALRWCK